MIGSNTDLLVIFLLQIGMMLMVGLIFGQLMRKISQPIVLGEIIGGIILGPTVFRFLLPDIYIKLFPGEMELIQAREVVIKIGMLFFMFVAGLEVNLTQLQHQKKSIFLVSFLGCLFPFCLGVAAIFMFPGIWGQLPDGKSLIFKLYIGIALSISALPVITRILMDMNLQKAPLGSVVITSAAINDLLGWAFFALLLSSVSGDSLETGLLKTIALTVAFTLLILVAGRHIGKTIFKWARQALVWPSGFLGVTAVFIFLAAAIAEMMNIHAIFGAFLIGVALFSVFEQNVAGEVKEIIYQFAVSLFAPLYFVSVGLKANFAANFDVQLVLLIILLATVGKVGGAGVGAWLSGIKFKDSVAIGFAMNARGAMEIILASVALDFGLIDNRIFVALVTMALVTSMMSGPMLQWLLKLPKTLAVNKLMKK